MSMFTSEEGMQCDSLKMNQLCKVCGEPAAGFHFGAFTCEGCKSFFGRSYNNLAVIQECKNGGQCVINKKNRTACKACRLRKCLLVGMSKSGSRYGRRSNWFKLHCLMQEHPSGNPETSLSRSPHLSGDTKRNEPPKDDREDCKSNSSSMSPPDSQSSDVSFDMNDNRLRLQHNPYALALRLSAPFYPDAKDFFNPLAMPLFSPQLAAAAMAASFHHPNHLLPHGFPRTMFGPLPGMHVRPPQPSTPHFPVSSPPETSRADSLSPEVVAVAPVEQEQPMDLSVRSTKSPSGSVCTVKVENTDSEDEVVTKRQKIFSPLDLTRKI